MQTDEILKKNIGAIIRASRKRHGLTQYALAEKIDMDEKQLSRLEAGKHFPTLKTLLAITDVLDMHLADFDDMQDLKDSNFYDLVEILKTATPRELKKYLSIIKIIKEK